MEQQAEPDTFMRSIVRVEAVPEEFRVNEALQMGWTLLATPSDPDGAIRYVVGWSSTKGEIQKPRWLAERDDYILRADAAAADHQRRMRAELGIGAKV